MHRGSGMKLAALALLAALWSHAQAQPLPEPGRRLDKAEPQPSTEQKPARKPRPRVSVKPKGGTGSAVGDDAPGGGPPTAEPSKGGTPGTPSGSFTGPPVRP